LGSTCDDMSGALFDYSVGELTDERRREVESHLAVCAACRGALREIEGTGVALKRVAARTIAASEEFQTSTRRLARVESQKRIAVVAEGRAPGARRTAAARAALGQKPGARYLILAGVIGAAIIALVVTSRTRERKAPPPLGDSVARLDAAAGSVELRFAGTGDSWSELAPGRRLFRGEAVRTGAGAVARFELSGGRTLWLGPSSRAVFSEAAGAPGFSLRLHGASAAVVASHGGPFRVETDGGSVATAGGAFAVSSADDVWSVELFEGSARVTSAQGEAALSPAQRAAVMPDGRIETAQADLAATATWRFRVPDAKLLGRLFAGAARLLEDGRAFAELSGSDWSPEQAAAGFTVEPGATVRTGCRLAGDVSFAVEVESAKEGAVSIGFVDEPGREMTFAPGDAFGGKVSFPSGGGAEERPLAEAAAAPGGRLELRVERIGSELRVYSSGRERGRYATDPCGPVSAFVRAGGSPVRVRSATVTGWPDDAWTAGRLGAVVPGR